MVVVVTCGRGVSRSYRLCLPAVAKSDRPKQEHPEQISVSHPQDRRFACLILIFLYVFLF